MNMCHLFNQTFPNKMTGEEFNNFNSNNLKLIKYLYKSSHQDYAIYECKECGALFIFEFYEYVNFNGGDDEIYLTYVQVENEEHAVKLMESRQVRGSTPAIHFNDDNSFKIVK